MRIALVALTALCACNTPDEMRSGYEPVTVASAHGAETVSNCILGHWIERPGYHFVRAPYQDGWTVQVKSPDGNNTIMVADAMPAPTGGSSISVRSWKDGLRRDLLVGVRNCG